MRKMTVKPPLDARLRDAYVSLPAAERRLADVALKRGFELQGFSATEMASQAGVSKATAARFFRRLGYADFAEFRQALRTQGEQYSPFARFGETDPQTNEQDHPLRAHLAADARRLAQWAQTVDSASAEKAVQMLAAARKVWVAGFRHSYVSAFYAQSLLAQVRPDVLGLNDPAGREADWLAAAGPKDVLLAVDFRRRSQRLPALLAGAAAVQLPLLLITDCPASRLDAQAAQVLRCDGLPQSDLFDSYAGAVSLINYLATAVARQRGARAQEQLQRIEQIHVALDDLAPIP